MHREFSVIVIGGGHAGVEAAWAAANMLAVKPGEAATVALVTIDPEKIGVMSCNPAIGGLAKGQLVREVDALNGLMGLATDATGIQFRVLNTSKGAAVHGPRAQCDKHAYAKAVQKLIASRPEIEVVSGMVESLVVEGRTIRGVEIQTASGKQSLFAPSVVLTTGTFMRGLMHTGESKTQGGRFGEEAAVGISGALSKLGFELGRLKTGTPPRLKRSSLKLETLKEQKGDVEPVPFSDLSVHGLGVNVPQNVRDAAPSLDQFVCIEQLSCFETTTNKACHDVIRANLHRAPMYSGQIESAGPRYCPSIEDKVVRFKERDVHHVFLEPESHSDDWIYCNGISTSLPADVQDLLVRSMRGCEDAVIYRYGYAVEYDMVRPHQIFATGMTKLIDGLFLAGQINGTSGYEEAAAQGVIAGINAANRVLGKGEFTLGRHEAYIGVMMDDLVTKTPLEPYRMFTSRAEYRLLLRADNPIERLGARAEEAGLLGGPYGELRREVMKHRTDARIRADRAISAATFNSQTLTEAMRGSDVTREEMLAVLPLEVQQNVPRSVWMTAHADYRYAAYMNRQRADIKRLAESELRRLPDAIDYHTIIGLRNEAKNALMRFRPATFGQASRLEGVTPSDLSIVAVHMRRYGDGRKSTQAPMP